MCKINNIIYIFSGGGVLEAPIDWYDTLNPEVFTDSYEELISGGKYMLLSEEQIAFHLKHPDYDLYHSFYMIEVTAEEKNEEIRKIREISYKSQSDPIYMSYLKYKEFGDTQRAEEAYTIWQNKVRQIDSENPYITEES